MKKPQFGDGIRRLQQAAKLCKMRNNRSGAIRRSLYLFFTDKFRLQRGEEHLFFCCILLQRRINPISYVHYIIPAARQVRCCHFLSAPLYSSRRVDDIILYHSEGIFTTDSGRLILVLTTGKQERKR